MSYPADWDAPGAQVTRRGRPTAIKGHLLSGGVMTDAHRIALAFIAGCAAFGCIAGLIVTTARILREGDRG